MLVLVVSLLVWLPSSCGNLCCALVMTLMLLIPSLDVKDIPCSYLYSYRLYFNLLSAYICTYYCFGVDVYSMHSYCCSLLEILLGTLDLRNISTYYKLLDLPNLLLEKKLDFFI